MHIFIVCYNEAIMIPHTVQHYRSRFPDCKITIHDNGSTDGSIELARSLGCSVIPFESDNSMNEYILLNLRNNSWKSADDWVIVCDMDEWVCVTKEQIESEEAKGANILRIKGYNIIGNSQTETLEDVDLHKISMGIFNPYECKSICFDARKIKAMNYTLGAHHCSPDCDAIVHSEKEYILKHMDELGFQYKCYKNKIRFERSEMMRSHNMLTHYVADNSILQTTLDRLQEECYDISNLF